MRLHKYVFACVYESLLGLHLQPITLSLFHTYVDAHTPSLSLSLTRLPPLDRTNGQRQHTPKETMRTSERSASGWVWRLRHGTSEFAPIMPSGVLFLNAIFEVHSHIMHTHIHAHVYVHTLYRIHTLRLSHKHSHVYASCLEFVEYIAHTCTNTHKQTHTHTRTHPHACQVHEEI